MSYSDVILCINNLSSFPEFYLDFYLKNLRKNISDLNNIYIISNTKIETEEKLILYDNYKVGEEWKSEFKEISSLAKNGIITENFLLVNLLNLCTNNFLIADFQNYGKLTQNKGFNPLEISSFLYPYKFNREKFLKLPDLSLSSVKVDYKSLYSLLCSENLRFEDENFFPFFEIEDNYFKLWHSSEFITLKLVLLGYVPFLNFLYKIYLK